MSDKPKIGSSAHAAAYPNKLSIYNADYDMRPPHNKDYAFDTPWWVDRGWEVQAEFATYEKALAYVRDRLSPCAST
jgi:hypothetical protein